MLTLQDLVPMLTAYRYRQTRGNLRPRHNTKTSDAKPNDFRPLQCNEGLSGMACEPWTKVFGAGQSFSKLVVIPCGTCVTLNETGSKLRLNQGIDIQGRLVIPDNTEAHIETSSIVVQGELSITSTSSVSNDPKIRVTIIGDKNSTIMPISNNKGVCDSDDCDVGPRSVAVAGGTLNCK